MFKASHNNIFGQSGFCLFETRELAQAWIDNHVSINTFGKPSRWLPDFLEGAETRIVGEGEFAQTEYLWPQEYEYEISEYKIPYQELRRKEYEAAGLTIEAWTIAIVEKETEGNDKAYNEMKAKRAEIKTRIPKE